MYAYPAYTETKSIEVNVQIMAEDPDLEPNLTGLIQRFDANNGGPEQAYAYPELDNTSSETNYIQENVSQYIDFISAQTMAEDPYLQPVETKHFIVALT